MALIDCPECGTQVSSAAPTCVKCGYPVAQAPDKGRFDKGTTVAGFDLSGLGAPTGPAHMSDTQAAVLLSQKKQTNHVLHLLLSMVTVGAWLIVWLLVANSNNRHNQRIDRQLMLRSSI
jgi:hypothetical protein